jgi:hypothetical protein
VRQRRPSGVVDRIDRDPLPADSSVVRSAKDRGDLPDRRVRETPAHVRFARPSAMPTSIRVRRRARRVLVLVARVTDFRRSMIDDILLTAAVLTAGPQNRTERVECFDVELGERYGPEEGCDVGVVLGPISTHRLHVNVGYLEVPLDELRDRCPRLRVALLVNLSEEPSPRLLGVASLLRPRRDDRLWIEPSLGDWSTPGVHANTKRSRWKHFDRPALSLPWLS